MEGGARARRVRNRRHHSTGAAPLKRAFAWEIAGFALPILVGLVLCAIDVMRPFGPAPSLRSYAPDEIAAIQDVVTTAGDTHHVLRAYAGRGGAGYGAAGVLVK